ERRSRGAGRRSLSSHDELRSARGIDTPRRRGGGRSRAGGGRSGRDGVSPASHPPEASLRRSEGGRPGVIHKSPAATDSGQIGILRGQLPPPPPAPQPGWPLPPVSDLGQGHVVFASVP